MYEQTSNRESVSIARHEVRELHISVSLRDLTGYADYSATDTIVVHVEYHDPMSSKIKNKALRFRIEELDE